MRKNITWLSLIATLFCASVSVAHAGTELLNQPKKDALPKSIFDDPIGGMVVNHTITVLGNDFYQSFASYWRQRDVENKYTISVYERPSARWGSEIWVQYRQKRVFHVFLSPRRQAAKEVSQQAVNIVYKNVLDSEIQRVLFQSQDLGKEEM